MPAIHENNNCFLFNIFSDSFHHEIVDALGLGTLGLCSFIACVPVVHAAPNLDGSSNKQDPQSDSE
jgi:hypothetical protein